LIAGIPQDNSKNVNFKYAIGTARMWLGSALLTRRPYLRCRWLSW